MFASLMRALWGTEGMGCLNSACDLGLERRMYSHHWVLGTVFSWGKNRPFDWSQVWAPRQWEMPAHRPARSAHQCGLGTAWQVGFHGRMAHTRARGGRSREENTEKNDLQAPRIMPGVGGHTFLPSSSPDLGLMPCPRGVLGLLLPGDGWLPKGLRVSRGRACHCPMEGLCLRGGTEAGSQQQGGDGRPAGGGEAFGAGVLVDWLWFRDVTTQQRWG